MGYKKSFTKIKVSGQTDVDADEHSDELTLVGGSNMTITTSGDNITFVSSVVGGGGGDVVNDTSPQLGGNLDVNGNSIVSASNANIAITPNGSGAVVLDGTAFPTSAGTAGQFLTTNGSNAASWATLRNSASLTLTHDNACFDLGTDAYTAKLTTLTGITIPANAVVTDVTMQCTEIFDLNTSSNPSGNAQIKIDGEWYAVKYSAESYGYISESDYWINNLLSFGHKGALQTIGSSSVNPQINIKNVTNDTANSGGYLTDGTLVVAIYWRF